MLRLQKYLAECGVASRRASEKLIAEGRVTVNGETAQLGCSIEPGGERVEVNGEPVEPDDKVYIVLNKPTDSITTAKDTHGRKTVLDLVRGARARVFPVGRLDKDVEGVLLLTNDGELAHRLMHPSYHVDKVYLAWVRGHMRPETALRMEKGIMLEDGMSAPAKVMILNEGVHTTQIRLTLHEGRKREVKRLCEAAGHPVCGLNRIAVGNVRTRGLRPGEWRYLTDNEVQGLHNLVQD